MKNSPQHIEQSDRVVNYQEFPDLMTEEELVVFLRITEISSAKNFHNVIENLKRMHGLPRLHLCGKALYPREAIKEWIKNRIVCS